MESSSLRYKTDSNEHIIFQVDSGASVNVIPERDTQESNLDGVPSQLKVYNGTTITPKGKCRFHLRNPMLQKKYSIEFVVVDDNLSPLLGRDTSDKMGLIMVNYRMVSAVQQSTL